MQVYALVGQSGTGKSHRALLVAGEYNIPAIIDDGLLISDGRILAGKSAKKSVSKIAAIRTALLSEDSHAMEMRQCLAEVAPNKILIIGTSKGMIQQIATRLGIAHPEVYIDIEDVSTKEEIATAKFKRFHKGTHVVPAPSMEVKQKLSVSLVEAFFHNKNYKHRPNSHLESSIVRPTYNTYGRLYIANQAVVEIVRFACGKIENVMKLSRVDVIIIEGAIKLSIDIEVKFGYPLPLLAQEIKKTAKFHVEKMTANVVTEVNVTIKKIHIVKTKF
jgi:uncharacterized alkaline shock family protein YloU